MQLSHPARREIRQANLDLQEALYQRNPRNLYGSVRIKRRGAHKYAYVVERRSDRGLEYLGAAENPQVVVAQREIESARKSLRAVASAGKRIRRAMAIQLSERAQGVLVDLALAKAFDGPVPLVLVGTHALAGYELMLGRKPDAELLVSRDVDFANDRCLSAAVLAEAPDLDLPEILRRNGFIWEPSRVDDEAGIVYDKWFCGTDKIEILTHRQGNDAKPVKLPKLGVTHAEPLPWLSYLCSEPMSVALPLRTPVSVKVPAPERFVWHKLAVAGVRKEVQKIKKDVLQAGFVAEGLLAAGGRSRLVDAWHAIPAGKFGKLIRQQLQSGLLPEALAQQLRSIAGGLDSGEVKRTAKRGVHQP